MKSLGTCGLCPGNQVTGCYPHVAHEDIRLRDETDLPKATRLGSVKAGLELGAPAPLDRARGKHTVVSGGSQAGLIF